jgi:organic hydroperoxide reductase OsmC/OhrA
MGSAKMENSYGIDLEWSLLDDVGSIATTSGGVNFSEFARPVADRGRLSPESLLLAAIASSYGIALARMLRDRSLPASRVIVHADGFIANEQGKPCVTRVMLRTTILGAHIPRQGTYKKATIAARDECIIGRAIRGNVAFGVGDVTLAGSIIE